MTAGLSEKFCCLFFRKMTAKDIQKELEAKSSPQKKEFLPYFFKTGKGQYGEGDKFIGVVVPDIRKVAKENDSLAIKEVKKLLNSDYHECRLCALIILIEQFKKAKNDELLQKQIVDFYLSYTHRVNNWDLVDLSCKDILGKYLVNKEDRNILYTLAESDLLWDQRIAVVSTFPFIKNEDYKDILQLSEFFLSHKHDLIHKAVGWMLREAGKMNKHVLTGFLDKHYTTMPRTMLRYSIEKLSPEERVRYMKK